MTDDGTRVHFGHFPSLSVLIVDLSKCPRSNLVRSLSVVYLRFRESFTNKKMGLHNIGNYSIYSIVYPLEWAWLI